MYKTIYSDQIKVNCPLAHDKNGYYHLIYRITNRRNGKIYIGKHTTKNPYDGYLGSGKAIKLAIEKYKSENFIKEILYCFTDETEAYLKEEELVTQEFVERNDTYNMMLGGKGASSGEGCLWYGKHHTQEAKDKISNSLKGKYVGENSPNFGKPSPMRGKHLSQDTRNKMSQNHADVSGEKNPMYGKKHTQETRNKISQNHRDCSGEKNPMYGRRGEKSPMYGRRGEKCPNYGKHPTQETREKLSKSRQGEKNPMYGRRGEKSPVFGANNPNAKAIIKLDELGNIVTEYGTVNECLKQECLYLRKLQKLINNHILHNGFYFEYKSKTNWFLD